MSSTVDLRFSLGNLVLLLSADKAQLEEAIERAIDQKLNATEIELRNVLRDLSPLPARIKGAISRLPEGET